MNGYDAIMQGRHGLRNMTQPSDTDYYRYSFKRNDKRGENGRIETEEEKERKGKVIHAYRDSSIGCENFCGYPNRSVYEMISRCMLRAMKNVRFL